MLYGYSNLFLNFVNPLTVIIRNFLIIFNALYFCFAICALYTQNKQWMSICFVVELATREDSHKNNENSL